MSNNKLSIANILSIPESSFVGCMCLDSENNTKTKNYIQKEVDEIIKVKKKRRSTKFGLYDEILKNCIQRIKNMNMNREVECFFELTDKINGYIEYDKDECADYLIYNLKKLDFDVNRVDYNYIYISWIFIDLKKNNL